MSGKIKCLAITKTQNQCSRYASAGSKYCTQHSNMEIKTETVVETVDETGESDSSDSDSESESSESDVSDSETETVSEIQVKNDSDLIKIFQNLYKYS
jgi:hypothetical protein